MRHIKMDESGVDPTSGVVYDALSGVGWHCKASDGRLSTVNTLKLGVVVTYFELQTSQVVRETLRFCKG